MKTQSHLIKTASVFCFISFHEKISGSVSSHENKIWFCFISSKKISSHSDSDPGQNQIRTENSDSCDQSSCMRVKKVS